MQYYKDKNTGEVYAYDQEQIDGGWVKEGLVPMTDEEVHAHLNPPIDPEQPADQARAERDRLLRESDFSQLPDAPVDAEAWATYRQALRDVPQQAGFPLNVDWPDKPRALAPKQASPTEG